ncbi:Suppressor of gamma response, partial [Thalictrum thalictroides]
TSWLVDSRRIATKIKSASEKCDPKSVNWKSNPSRACPKCNYVIDNSDVVQEWPGLPCGVKFDPSDQEIIWHLLAKAGNGNVKPHPFIEEFIPTVNEEDGICYAHPQNLPGVKQDGSVSHFFHRAIKAYNTGTRKRRKIHGDDLGDVRWHKTGRTKPVILDGLQMGCKKIMVLYSAKSGKTEKTNWVMHQYHLGTGEDEKDGEFVVSKVFYQQQTKLSDKVEEYQSCDISEAIITTTKVDPVTPKSVIPEPPRTEKRQSNADPEQVELCSMETFAQNPVTRNFDELSVEDLLGYQHNHTREEQANHMVGDHDGIEDGPNVLKGQSQYPELGYHTPEDQENDMVDDHDDNAEDPKLLAGQSQYAYDSQQLSQPLLNTQEILDGLHLCDEFLQSQPLNGESDFSCLGKEVFKKVIEDYQPLDLHDDPNDSGSRMLDPSVSNYVQGAEDPQHDSEEFRNSQLDPSTDPEFRLSQIEFGSEEFSLGLGASFG